MRIRLTALVAASALYAACGGSQPPAETPTDTPPAAADMPPADSSAADTAPAPKAEVKPLLDRQKAFADAEEKAFNAHDAKAIAALYAEDAVSVRLGPNGLEEQKGRAPVEKMFAEVFAAYPDMKTATRRVLANKDVSIAQWVATGTHKGEFMGMKATNKPVGFHGATLFWINDAGLVKRAMTYMDGATIAGQIGMMKAPVRKPAQLPDGAATWVLASGDAAEGTNMDMVKAFYASIDAKDEKKFLEMVGKDGVHVDYTMPEDSKGQAGAKKEMAMIKKSFPDMKMSAPKIWGFGPNFVVAEVEFSGTHTGPLGPIKATNKKFHGHGLDVIELKDGKFVRGESYGSMIELMSQLGLMEGPKPGDKPATPAKGEKTAAAAKATPAEKSAAPAKPAAKK